MHFFFGWRGWWWKEWHWAESFSLAQLRLPFIVRWRHFLPLCARKKPDLLALLYRPPTRSCRPQTPQGRRRTQSGRTATPGWVPLTATRRTARRSRSWAANIELEWIEKQRQTSQELQRQPEVLNQERLHVPGGNSVYWIWTSLKRQWCQQSAGSSSLQHLVSC